MKPTTQVLSLKEVFRKTQLWIMLIGASATFILLFVVTLWSFNTYLKRNVQILGQTLSELVQPAIVFHNDEYLEKTVNKYLDSYSVSKIEIIDFNGSTIIEQKSPQGEYVKIQQFITYLMPEKAVYFDVLVEDNTKIATVKLYPSSEQLAIYFVQLFCILLFCLLCLMLCWLYSVKGVYHLIMNTIKPLMNTAELVSEQKAYNLRFKKSAISEFNILIQVFNQLLGEIQVWHRHLQEQNEELTYQATHDELTGLPNRHVFFQTLNDIFKDENARQTSVLMFIDNDNFKEINDRYGHQAGDAVLQEMAKRLKSCIRKDDLFVRIGGDEFAIILQSVNKFAFLPTIAQNLLKCREKPLFFEDQEIRFGFSIGMACSPYAQSVDQWIEHADRAMYQAKDSELHWAIFNFEDEGV